MPSTTSEFKAGLLVLVALGIVVWSFFWSVDGVAPGEEAYTLTVEVPNAAGLYEGTSVKLAGVEVGSVSHIRIEDDRAELTLRIRSEYKLAEGTQAALKSSGLLGDQYVALYPGDMPGLLREGARIEARPPPGDLDTITRNLEAISDDIKSITGILRETVEREENVGHVEATLANLDAITEQVRLAVEANRSDVDAIIDSVRRLTRSLEGYTHDIAGDVDDEMARLKDLTGDLDETAENLASITGKVDAGQGTIGALINDDETITSINETVGDVRRGVRSLLQAQPEFYYIGRYYMGTQPDDLAKFPTGNELAWNASNTIGIRLRPHEDFWYLFELVDHPQGTLQQREVYREDTGTYEVRWIRTRGYKISFQVEKRWGPASFRLGLREGGGGVGLTFYAAKDKLQFSADLFSFMFGSYPAVSESGVPNLRAFVRYAPWKNVFFEAGAEQIVLGAKNGFFTGYVGVGFTFADPNLRGVLLTAPLGAL
jgi:phospholipid/cholesterol/gamma-HCH transport system substrate-binding protein